ncbi:MAG: hypothetical protein NWE93_00185 [Candidatus Bathyarchaeota archaeon]|nr:hypothetical protein [Candidatus Bathyarchaeota archaeon]
MLTIDISTDVQLFTELGLSPLQAQVYITLAKMEKATIKAISAASKIDRANVYRVMSQLQKLGLVEKMLANPTSFKAVSVQDAMTMLLEDNNRKYEEIKKKAIELLQRHKQENETLPDIDECQFALVPCGKLTFKKIDEMLTSTQKSHDLLGYCRDFSADIDNIYPRAKTLLARGVKVRHIIFLEENEKPPKELSALKKYGLLEVKFTRLPPRSTVSIYDNKQAFVSIFPSLSNGETPSLWISNLGIVSIIQSYFEDLWQNSLDLP